MKSQRRDLVLLYFTLAVILLGFGVIISLEAFLVDQFRASGQELGALISLFALCQLIFSPIWGSISDSVGRKPILIVGAVGNALSGDIRSFDPVMDVIRRSGFGRNFLRGYNANCPGIYR